MDDISFEKVGESDSAAEDNATKNLQPPSTNAKNEEDYIHQALRFLASASSETLGGIAVGLSACTYFVLGRVGLVLIGITAGVVLHATWEKQNNIAWTEDARRERGLDVVKRILDLRDTRTVADNVDDVATDTPEISFEGFQPETKLALNELVEVRL